MKITLRLIVALLLAAALVASAFSYLQVRSERTRLNEELERRAGILAESLQETVTELVRADSSVKLKRLVEKFGNRERLIGIIVFDNAGSVLAETPGLSAKISGPVDQLSKSANENGEFSTFVKINGRKTHAYLVSLRQEESVLGSLGLFHDASYISVRLREIWKYNFLRLLVLSLLITLTTVLVVRWSITGPIAKIAVWLKSLRMGVANQPISLPRGDILGPLAEEVAHLAKSLAQARSAAEEEARLRISSDSLWTEERLKEFIKNELGGKNLYVISNREPYMHVRQGRKVECIVPAGGLVTALDPILRACGGVWLAHGSGDADMETSDEKGKLRVPPNQPSYTLKRVWLTKEEEEGYYYGFSNEGMWPLCHITHTRPVFRLDDWINYQKVNEKFCEALQEEISGEEAPLVLIQDYHFALLPLLIKAKKPDAKVAIFWHIPWPNPEAFGICPWKKEILLGMLGADLVGFHTQFHCNNFLETVDRFLESKINWDEFSVERHGHATLIKPFPISVAFPASPPEVEKTPPNGSLRESILKEIGVNTQFLGVGVDRIDYTKGIIERFRAVERFIQKYPDFSGKFTFVELGAPSRTHIKRYHDLLSEVEETADKINWSLQAKSWRPIVFLKAHHSHEAINRYYKTADVCLVTSLHDGMNLVAKEYIASRSDESGVLILSQFTGAARELHDALMVNPYDIEEMADAIYAALTMKPDEKTERMRRLRQTIRERNIYRWAGTLVSALVRMRVQ
ncbi:MAG: trehalose-6-phosphate synthase [bacterium]|nr:trehalose-6-phosphate synthase [bacterium]